MPDDLFLKDLVVHIVLFALIQSGIGKQGNTGKYRSLSMILG